MNRRQLLRQAAALPAILASSVGAQGDFWRQPRSIWLQRMTHSGLEEVKAVYFADGRVVADGYLAACRLLRDVRAGQAGQMSVVLLDILCGIPGFWGASGHWIPLRPTSGYRSPETNAPIEGAVRTSMHIQGRAWDGLMQGVPA